MSSKPAEQMDFKKEIRKLSKLFDSKRYVEVIVLGVQLLDLIAIYILEGLEQEVLENAEHEPEEKRWLSVYREYISVMAKHRGRDAGRVKLAEVLYEDFEYLAELDVTPSLFQKVNRVFQFRNKLAHEYYLSPRTPTLLRARAKDCLDVLERFYDATYF